MSTPVLSIDSLSKHFGGVKAVQDAQFTVAPGSITALIGPNGAGKTTLFNMVTCLYTATSGAVHYHAEDGRRVDLTRCKADEIARLRIARTFQNIRLFSDVPALDNVKLGTHCRTHAGFLGALFPFLVRAEEDDVEAAAFRYLEFVGLGHKSHELARNLPYGEQRRLEIARALALDPRLLLLDEPAAGMNPQETEELMELIQRIRGSGITVLLIEHDMKLVMGISEHVVVLDHGEVIARGAPAEIAKHPEVIRAYLGDEAL